MGLKRKWRRLREGEGDELKFTVLEKGQGKEEGGYDRRRKERTVYITYDDYDDYDNDDDDDGGGGGR